MKKIKILFVCLGNICRSPLAEGIFDHMVDKKGFSQSIESDSAGTAAYHIGELPDTRSIDVALTHGIILHHRGRQFSSRDFQRFDYILAMDQDNFNNIERLKTSNSRAAVYLMRAFDPKNRNADVPDPYYGGQKGFEEVYEMLVRASEELFQEICDENLNA